MDRCFAAMVGEHSIGDEAEARALVERMEERMLA